MSKPAIRVGRTDAGNGLDVSRGLSRVAEGRAELLDHAVHVVLKIHECARGSKSLPYLLSSHDFSGLVEQHRQDAKKLGQQVYEHTILPQFARSTIHVEDAETKGATAPRFFLFPHCSTLREGTIGSNH
jgi:hypothetical protein